MNSNWKNRLSAIEDIDVEWNRSLSEYTTLRVGGNVTCIVYPRSIAAAVEVVEVLRISRVPYFVLGKGSNLLVAETLPEMVAISLEKGARNLEIIGSDAGILIGAGGGVSISRLMRFCIRERLGGLEFLAGIPGTVGGAVMMNAGTKDGEISDVLENLTILTKAGKKKVNREEIAFSYRTSSIPGNAIVWHVTLRSKRCDRKTIRRIMTEILRKRRAGQPAIKGTAGSIFKNPPGDYAGRLIEETGLKGRVLGGAKISEKHANWIVTTRGAKADDVYGLIRLAQREVEKKFRTRLEPEIRLIGFE